MVDTSSEHVAVTPDTLRKAGDGIVGTADELHRDISELEGWEAGTSGANRGFAAATAVVDCASGWDEALRLFGTKIAVAGDNVVLSAATYDGTEHGNRLRFGPR